MRQIVSVAVVGCAAAIALAGCKDSTEPQSGAPVASSAETNTSTSGAPVGTNCGDIKNNIGGTSPVIVLEGTVDCALAVTVSQEYFREIAKGKAEGQGLFLTVRGWSCSWPYVDGRSHAESYQKCVAPGKKGSVKIGE